MSTIVRFGPLDHGRRVSGEELAGARWQEGYTYEVIDGRLYVSPVPNLPQEQLEGVSRDDHGHIAIAQVNMAKLFALMPLLSAPEYQQVQERLRDETEL